MKKGKLRFYVCCVLVLALLLSGCAAKTGGKSDGSEGFVLLAEAVPDVILEVRYYSTYNFVGTRVDGYEEPVAIICDEEAKLTGKQLNRALRDEDGKIYDVVAGTFLIVGLGEEDFTSLSPEHMKEFKEKFDTPEMFMRLNGKLVVLPMEERVKAKKPSVLQKLNDMKGTDAPTAAKKTHAKEER